MKTTKALIISAALLSLPLANAQADILQFWNPETSSFVTTDQLDLTSTTGSYSATQNLGADKTMTAGDDTFTEIVSFYVSSSSLGGGPTSFDLVGNYRLDVQLNGVFANITNPISINADNTLNNVLNTQFDVQFTSGIINLYGDAAFISGTPGTGTNISSLSFIAGGATAIQFAVGQAIGDVALIAAINNTIAPCTTNCDAWIRDASGASIVNALQYLTITTASAKFLSTTAVYSTGIQTVNFQDDQGSTVFQTNNVPEPSSLFLIGAGLIGLGFTSRRKNTSSINA